MALKSARIVDLCCESSGFANFENTADHGSAVIFEADSGLCLSYVRTLGPKRIWITNLSSALIGMLMSSSKLFPFSKEVHFIFVHGAVVIKHVAFFTILAKLTVVFTSTSLPLNLYTSIFGCGCGFGFEQKFWRIDGFGEKKGTDRRICIPLFTPLYMASPVSGQNELNPVL